MVVMALVGVGVVALEAFLVVVAWARVLHLRKCWAAYLVSGWEEDLVACLVACLVVVVGYLRWIVTRLVLLVLLEFLEHAVLLEQLAEKHDLDLERLEYMEQLVEVGVVVVVDVVSVVVLVPLGEEEREMEQEQDPWTFGGRCLELVGGRR